MWEFILGLVLGALLYRYWTYPRTKPTKPGLNKDIFLDHKDDVELYYNTMSSASQKVRAALGELGVKFRPIHKILPTSGVWETKSPEYLRINPAGTVPVLVHKGHPVYESHEQLLYISQHLSEEGKQALVPSDPSLVEEMERMVDQTAMIITSEMLSDPRAFLRRRAGNLLGPMSVPLFCANVKHNFSWMLILNSLRMLPFVSDRKFIIMFLSFKMFDVEGIRKLAPLYRTLQLVRDSIQFHFDTLEEELGKRPGPYLFGEEFTLADIGWISIFQRMEFARWWPVFSGRYPRIHAYWDTIQQRAAYMGSRPEKSMLERLDTLGKQIDRWKLKLDWFKQIYSDAKTK